MTDALPKIGIITISDRASSGEYEDLSGPAIEEALRDYLATECDYERVVIPDEVPQIVAAIEGFAERNCALICTTGGTGPAPRDVTPEATEAVCDKCGYDLGGHEEAGACPECGDPFRPEPGDVTCPGCGEETPAHFEVCWNCGAPTASGSSASGRTSVSVLSSAIGARALGGRRSRTLSATDFSDKGFLANTIGSCAGFNAVPQPSPILWLLGNPLPYNQMH